MRRGRGEITRMEIVKCATGLFLENGFTTTSANQLSTRLSIAPGNLTYYFPTKDHLLLELVQILCDFQWEMMEREARQDQDHILALALELAAMATICQEDPVARDFYVSVYTSPMCLSFVRKNDAQRAKKAFAKYCADWTKEQFDAAEMLETGMELAMLMEVSEPVTLELRIESTVDAVLKLYNIPGQLRQEMIRRVLAMDYHAVGRRMLRDFKQYVTQSNEQALSNIYRQRDQQRKS